MAKKYRLITPDRSLELPVQSQHPKRQSSPELFVLLVPPKAYLHHDDEYVIPFLSSSKNTKFTS